MRYAYMHTHNIRIEEIKLNMIPLSNPAETLYFVDGVTIQYIGVYNNNSYHSATHTLIKLLW